MSYAEHVTLPLRNAPRLPPPQVCQDCGKHRYATQQAAEAMLDRLHRQRGSEGRLETRAYYEHGWWHLTSAPERITTDA